MPTKQETFDTVVRHLKQQGRQVVGPDGACAYLTSDGLKCAAGVLIPEGRYSKTMEEYGGFACGCLSDLKLDDWHPMRDILEEEGHDVMLVAQLQYVHDSWREGKPWPPTLLRKVADNNGLSMANL